MTLQLRGIFRDRIGNRCASEHRRRSAIVQRNRDRTAASAADGEWNRRRSDGGEDGQKTARRLRHRRRTGRHQPLLCQTHSPGRRQRRPGDDDARSRRLRGEIDDERRTRERQCKFRLTYISGHNKTALIYKEYSTVAS